MILIVMQYDAHFEAGREEMKAITLRQVPERLAREVEERARKTGNSLNRTVIQMLAESVCKDAGPPYDDLDHLAGTWGPEEAEELDRALKGQRLVDESLWK